MCSHAGKVRSYSFQSTPGAIPKAKDRFKLWSRCTVLLQSRRSWFIRESWHTNPLANSQLAKVRALLYILPNETFSPPKMVIGTPGAKNVLLRVGYCVSPLNEMDPKGRDAKAPLLSYGVEANCPAV
jgi:hypothetical protein